MLIKIKGQTKKQLLVRIEQFTTMTAQICNNGYKIKGNEVISYREKNTIHLGTSNNEFINIREEKDLHVVVEFNFRYDKVFKKRTSISNLMLAFFDFTEEVGIDI